MSTTTACVNSNMNVRVFGDAAVVTGTVTSSGTRKGVAYKDRQVLFTDTYVRATADGSAWQVRARLLRLNKNEGQRTFP